LIKTGDQIITLVDAPVRLGQDTLATVSAGTKLTAIEVRGDWVLVTIIKDAKEIKGWISIKQLKSVAKEKGPNQSDPKPKSPTQPRKFVNASEFHLQTKETSLTKIQHLRPVVKTKKLSTELSASPDSRHVANTYAYPDQFTVVVDGKDGKPFDSVVSKSVRFTSDGQCVYAGRRGKNWYVVVAGVEIGPFESLGNGSPLLTADGKKIYFLAQRDKKWTLVIDGQEQPSHERILGSPVLNADGSRFAYTFAEGQKYRVSNNGTFQQAFDKIRERSLRFSPDGKHLAYVARHEKKQVLVVDGVESEPLNVIFPGGEVAFNRSHTVVTMGIRGRDLVRMETEVVPAEESSGRPQLRSKFKSFGKFHKGIPPKSIIVSPDGRRLAWVSLRPDKKFEVVVDGVPSKSYDAIRKGTLTFSPN
jgi:hypothetical protein